jgi:hypothetical protein
MLRLLGLGSVKESSRGETGKVCYARLWSLKREAEKGYLPDKKGG